MTARWWLFLVLLLNATGEFSLIDRRIRILPLFSVASEERCIEDPGGGGGGSSCDATKKEEECVDSHEHCSFWASKGECDVNPVYMHKTCKKSCKKCGPRPTLRSSPLTNETSLLLDLISEYGTPQTIEGDKSIATLSIIRQSVSYMKNFVHSSNPTHRIPGTVISSCQNRQELCSFWAAIGECEANPPFMVTNCAPSCRSCHKIDFETRCPKMDERRLVEEAALKPGDLNLMFERIVAEAETRRGRIEDFMEDGVTPNYSVTVHLRPDAAAAATAATAAATATATATAATAATATATERALVDIQRDRQEPPWIITFDNLLTSEECDHMIQLGYKEGYKRSKDVGPQKFDGSFEGYENERRTSKNAWCSKDCREDPITTRIHDRMSTITGIPPENSEDLQLLKYEVGEFYRIHHDYIDHQRDRQCGPRILTFFLYLSDVEWGGGTAFANLDNITVTPKKGRALLWPSVFSSDPKEKDGRTMHEALPVGEGTKFAANAWIHLYDYLTPQSVGCS